MANFARQHAREQKNWVGDFYVLRRPTGTRKPEQRSVSMRRNEQIAKKIIG